MKGIVIGAGVSGLAAARRWLQLDPGVELEVLEASDAPGGWLRTEERDGFVVELGPDAMLTERPAGLALARSLGLEARLVTTRADRRGAYVVSAGRLVRVPAGFSMLAPADPWAFLASDLLSVPGRLRALLEPCVPRRRATDSRDESLARFVRRRFGAELLERLAQPLVAGIYGADAETLSLAATMPRFLAMEREHGSVVRALRAGGGGERVGSAGARYGLFVAFDRGMQVLTDALARAVGERLHLRAPVRAIERDGAGFTVVLEHGETRRADAVVLAVGAWQAARLLRPLDDALADGLDAIPYGSAATVTFAWRTSEIPRPLDAYGFVVPEIERRAILASTWASAKWPGRAPQGWELVRVFFGGAHEPDAAERDDASLVSSARRELRALMGIEAPPAFARVVRYPRAMPLYRVGHLERARAIEARLERWPALALAGNALFGVGIPDAIASGERAAARVASPSARPRGDRTSSASVGAAPVAAHDGLPSVGGGDDAQRAGSDGSSFGPSGSPGMT